MKPICRSRSSRSRRHRAGPAGQNKASGALVPPDFIGILPEPGDADTTGLMSLTVMQFLSPSFKPFAGKLYGLSSDDNAFAHDFRSYRAPPRPCAPARGP